MDEGDDLTFGSGEFDELGEDPFGRPDSSGMGGRMASGLQDMAGEPEMINETEFITTSQEYIDAQETIRQLKERLVRRTNMIDDIRKYYLRDVITVKYILRDVLSDTEREAVMKQYDSRLPSLDLRQALIIHAPTKCEMQVRPCDECGGQLEIIMKDSDEVERLKKVIADCRERENRFRVKLATLDTQIETTSREKAEAAKSHMEEVSVNELVPTWLDFDSTSYILL